MEQELSARFLALRKQYIEGQFGKLNPVQREAVFYTEGPLLTQLQELVLKQEGVLALDDIKTRQFGSRYFVDVEIACDGDLSLREAHAIASRVHDEIEHHFPETKHCLVHVNPYGEEH